MFYPSLVNDNDDLQQILRLQQLNLKQSLDTAERQAQGFVTLRHDLDTLEKMHALAPSVVIRKDDKVAGYALTMLQECRHLMPDLDPMFALFDTLQWNDKPLRDYPFYVMGQVCIAREYRGQGLFEQLYAFHKKIYSNRFNLLLTEIATRNGRSMRAHERVGFKIIHIHRDALDEWAVTGWDWN